MIKAWQFGVSRDGVLRLTLPFGFGVGFTSRLICEPSVFDWRNYIYAHAYEGELGAAWQVKLLWFCFGRQVEHKGAPE